MSSTRQRHQDLPQTKAMARREDSSLRRGFSAICGYGGGSDYSAYLSKSGHRRAVITGHVAVVSKLTAHGAAHGGVV
jgi:hypothetical protein